MNRLLFLVFFVFSFSTLFAQPIIPASNKVDWSQAGYPGTIPSPANSINVINDHDAQADAVTDDGPAIQAALDAANPGDVVYLPAGTYLIQNQLTIDDNIVLRGDCSGGTILQFDLGGANTSCIEVLTYQYGTFVSITDGLDKGTSVVSVNDASNFTVGSFADFRQDNDPDLMYTESTWNVSWAEHSQGQVSEVIAIDGNQITIAPPLTMNFDATLNPEVRPIGLKQGVGIEDLAIERLDQGDDYTIEIKNTANCWVRNVESYNTVKSHIWVTQSLHFEVRECYFHHSYDYGGGGHGYGVTLGHHATACLVENNIFKTLRHAMMVKQGTTANVFAYNYSIDPYWGNPENIPTDISLHGHYPNMNLFESNIVQEVTSADYWGPSGPGNTFFRNRIETSNLKMADASHYQNVIGNELTAGSNVVEVETSVDNTLIHGNNENGSITWDGGIGTQDLPDSYFLTTVPDYWGVMNFPSMGPEFALGSGTIPAKIRYDNGQPNTCNFLLDPTILSLPDLEEMEETATPFQLYIFPNPVAEQLTVQYHLLKRSNVRWELVHISGVVVKSNSLGKLQEGEGNWQLDIEDLAKGSYWLMIEVNNRVYKEMIVKS